ncbi:MAG: co-chaperone GroES [Phototrophicales bacterium]|nr:MAG: co-chaperone GroES [Phototrophicales bacterium]
MSVESKLTVKLRPLADRVIVEPKEVEETFAGGQLVLPETAKEKPQQATVIAVGPGRRDEDGEYIPLDVKEGDTILFAKYAGTEVKIHGVKYLILKESDILAVVESN